MKITIIYDNTTIRKDLKKDWGFSCLIEAYERRILFDTGGSGAVLLGNMKRLEIDPVTIDDVFISHNHFDHIGGLSAFLDENDNVTVHVPTSLKGIRIAKKVLYYAKPCRIHDNFYTTGELDHIEQSLAIKTGIGLVLIAGCSHPGMKTIFNAVSQFGRIEGIVGGFHGFDQLEFFKDLEFICPCHCTKYMQEIKSRYPGKYIEGGAGTIIERGKGTASPPYRSRS
jgi:7,8-dihydropterin-6-yl-methyl-4-(beta-D-ribofuranosyl)aminobenzene 5'-phosphate synthase